MDLEASMRRIPGWMFLSLAMLVCASPAGASNAILVAGTLIQCTVDEPNFSTRTARADEPIVCHMRSLRAFGCDELLVGSELSGRLVDLQQPGHFYGKGWMRIEFDRLVLPQDIEPISAKVIAIRGMKVDADGQMLGKGHPVRDAAEWAVPVLWPVKVLTLPERGPAPALRGEHTVTLRLMDDLQVPCSDPSQAGWHRFGTASWTMSSPYR